MWERLIAKAKSSPGSIIFPLANEMASFKEGDGYKMAELYKVFMDSSWVWVGSAVFVLGLRRCSFVRYSVPVWSFVRHRLFL
jgi:hypothetical protein